MAEQYADKQIKLFSLTANREIAEKISQASGIPLGKMSSRQFSDGEIMINIEETVRGDDIYIIQSTSFPVNDNLWELLIMIDACKRASANTVNIVVPYFGYSRQDRIAASREPITAKLVANMLVKAGVDRVLTLDLHAVQVQGFFDIQLTIFLLSHYLLNTIINSVSLVKMSSLLVLKILESSVLVVWQNTLTLQLLSLIMHKMILNVKKAILLVR